MKKPAPPDAPSRPRTRYERHWGFYSRAWRWLTRRGFEQVGDEWGPPDFVQTVVERFCRPYCGPEATVLEIGCGGARFSKHLAPRCGRLDCLDVSQPMLDRAEAALAEFPNVSLVKGDGLTLAPFPDGRFDFVFSFDTFVHLSLEDSYGYLLEIFRVLRPAGVAAIHFPNLLTDLGWQKFREEAPEHRGGDWKVGRFHFLDPPIVRRLGEETGFRVEIDEEVNGRDLMAILRKPTPGE